MLGISAALLLLVLLYGRHAADVVSIPRINEICTSNFSIASDLGGNYLDYVELYNPTDADCAMDGLWLSNDKDTPHMFDMSGITVPAHGYTVIWMMDVEEQDEVMADLEEALEPHETDWFNETTTLDCLQYYCSFDVPRKGGYLYLSDSSRILESVRVPALTYNVAYGCTTDGGGSMKGLEPTPGASNNDAQEINLKKAEEPVLSAESGFYDVAFGLTISHAMGTTVYYTLDGSEPTTESARYTMPITIDDVSDQPNVYSACEDIYPDTYIPQETVDKAVVVRAIAVDNLTGAASDVVSRTYFVGYGNKTAYQDIAVVSLITDPENLFDYDKGIYVKGATYDWYKEMAGAEDLGDDDVPLSIETEDGKSYSRYKFVNSTRHGREWEREVTVEYYDSTHTLQLAQDGGIRIAGLSTRFHGQKSFNLYARSIYGEDTWQYPFWGYDGVSKIRLRASDDEVVNWKEAFVQSIASGRSCGTQQTIPVAVFIDGEYWGMYQLTEQFDATYFENHYGVDEDDLVIIKNGTLEEGSREDEESWDFLERLMLEEYDPAYDYYYGVMSEYVNMDGFLDFYATTIYLNNVDIGLDQNYERWCSKAEGGDHRWQFLIYDMDSTLGNPADNTLEFYRTDRRFYWPRYLCTNAEFKERYVTTIMDLANVEYSYNRVHDRLMERAQYLAAQSIENKHRNASADYSASDYVGDVQDLDDFFRLRRSYMEQYMAAEFDLGPVAAVNITNSDINAGAVKVNTSVLTAEDYTCVEGSTQGIWTGEYFTDYSVTLTAVAVDGYTFAGWTGDMESTEATITVPLTEDGIHVQAVFVAE